MFNKKYRKRSYNMNVQEYEMLRQEILQYLAEYQNVRNMMYVITVTILGFALSGKNNSIYIYLLPIAVILPSYIISNDHWKAVTKAAAYLTVFYEREKECPFKWETYHREFNKEFSKNGIKDLHRMPYVTCAFVCLFLYSLNIDVRNICCIETIFRILVGMIVLILCIVVFAKFRKREYREFLEAWEKVRDNNIEIEKIG